MRIPNLQQLTKHPLTGSTLLLACIISLSWWSGMSIDYLAMGYEPLEQQLWTPFTATLPHVNILHLLLNCYWVLCMGSWLEDRYGKLRTIGYFALWAAASSIAEFALLDGGVGLSGVGYALWAFFSVLRRKRYLVNGPIDERDDQLFVAWFFVCIVLTRTGIMPVANIAHGAGAVFGALSAMCICGDRKLWRTITTVALLAVLAAGTALRTQLNMSAGFTQQLAYESWLLYEQERWPDAEAKLRQVLKRTPYDADSWARLGSILHQQERDEEAGEAIERAYALSPSQPFVIESFSWWHEHLAFLASNQGDYATAAKHYQLCCNLQPGDVRLRLGAADALAASDDIAAAREAYEIVLRLEPDNERAKQQLKLLTK
jgi:membrane associated rhomboid family serine protease